jgi:hypothetical protein
MFKNLTALFVKYGVRKGRGYSPMKKNSYLCNKTCSSVVYIQKEGRKIK